jgi:hypothetical protein
LAIGLDRLLTVREAWPNRKEGAVSPQTITLEMSRPDAEVLVGVLASERHNAEVEAVCDALRAQLDEKLAEAG